MTEVFHIKNALKKANNKLESEKELFSVLLEKNKAGFWYWDLEKNKQRLSSEIKAMLSLEDQDSSTVSWQSRISPKELKIIKSNLNEHFSSQGSVPFYQEIKNILPNGSPLWVICFGKVFRWNRGKPQRMIGCFIDITKNKTSEEIIIKQNESLRKISFNQSHHMRAKVANILGLLNILDDKKITDDNKEYLKLLKYETEKLDKIIRENVSDAQETDLNISSPLFR
ncbi:PAS domain-containing protein [Anditalea andensis]|uniref:PAS domain-containing protein n=1 Tax=Anditalea andensis TaxID=1048983 RepID=UPI001969CA42|nr:PAS domain-containing protein [Anditalea andensis]